MMMRKVAFWIGLFVGLGWSSGASALPVNNPITAGLVAAYEFSGNADDVSGNGNNGVVNGATLTADRFGNVGSAYSFGSANDSILVVGSVSGLSDYTQSLWVKSLDSEETDFEHALLITPIGTLFYEHSTKNLRVLITEDREGGTTSNPHTAYKYVHSLDVVDEAWFHIAVTAHSDNTANLFINGTEVALGPRVTDGGGVGDVLATVMGAGENPNQYQFSGSIDDVYIYDRALSPSEVSTLFSVVPEPSTALLLGIGLSALAARSRAS